MSQTKTYPTPWQNLRAAWSRLRTHWREIIGTSCLIGLPLAVISLSPGLTNDPTISAYSGLGVFILILAVASAIASPRNGPGRIRAHLYYGTSAFVRLILAVAWLVLLVLGGFTIAVGRGTIWLGRLLRQRFNGRLGLVFLGLWVVVGAIVTLAAATMNLFSWVILGDTAQFSQLLGALPVILALTIVVLPALIIVGSHLTLVFELESGEVSPLGALRAARRRVQFSRWQSFLTICLLLLVLLLAGILALVIVLPLGLVMQFQRVPQALFAAIFSVLIVPFGLCYIYEFYRSRNVLQS